MEWLQAVILGVVQGLSEPLPVSSSAHLLIVPWLLNWGEPAADLKLTFDLALHLGTTLALLLCFQARIRQIVAAFLRFGADEEARRHRRLGVLLVLGCIPAGLAGVLFDDFLESRLRSPLVAAIPLGLFALVLFWADHAGKKAKTLADITPLDTLLIGAAQALALVPGVSRSGITLTAGLLLGYRREEAATFSFLMMTPLTVGACLLKFKEAAGLLRRGAWPDFWTHDFPLMLAGTVASFVVCLCAVKFLLRLLKSTSLDCFVAYRLALAALVGGVFWIRTLS